MTDLTFTASPQKVADLLNELRAGGTTVTQHSATEFGIEGHGIKAEAKYADPILTVVVLSKPFYVSAAMISSGISKALVG